MVLSGLQIFKLLPGGKKEPEANCKKCGFPTCMAFAMKLAKAEADLNKCEYISDELRNILEEASQKQQEMVEFGVKNPVKIGDETVMFRHDKTFVNPTGISVEISSDDVNFDEKLSKIESFEIERVGETFKISAIALLDKDDSFVDKAIRLSSGEFSLVLSSENVEKIKKVLDVIKASKPLINLQNVEVEEIIEISKNYSVPVVISAETLEKLNGKAEKTVKAGLKEIVLSLEKPVDKNIIQDLTYLRRFAIEEKKPPFGFPVMMKLDLTENSSLNAINATVLLCKYSNLIVLNEFDEALISALMTLRQNIYTDPQKPLQVEPKIYEIGEVNPNSPVFVTTNFALTYFAVVSELEASGVSSYLVITPSDGMSVLTAWSAQKLTGEIIAKAVKEYKLEEKINHKNIVIPGFVASLAKEIEEELPGWNIIPGSNEASDIIDFIKNELLTIQKV